MNEVRKLSIRQEVFRIPNFQVFSEPDYDDLTYNDIEKKIRKSNPAGLDHWKWLQENINSTNTDVMSELEKFKAHPNSSFYFFGEGYHNGKVYKASFIKKQWYFTVEEYKRFLGHGAPRWVMELDRIVLVN